MCHVVYEGAKCTWYLYGGNVQHRNVQSTFKTTVSSQAPSTVMDMGDSQKKQQPMLQQPYYQQDRFQPNYELSFAQMQQSRAQPMAASMGYGGLYGNMAQVRTSISLVPILNS